MTSGNFSNEPIVKDNEEALEKLSHLADSFLLHNREIYVQCDDSVVRVLATEDTEKNREKIKLQTNTNNNEFDKSSTQNNSKNLSENSVFSVAKKSQILPIRRSRGYAPFPVELPFEVPNILAVGGELKAAFCLTKKNFAFMSQHIGDMENLETLQSFEKSFEQMKALFRVEPEIIVCDKHPNYLSSNWARENAEKMGAEIFEVQHHHAHIASVMAENGLQNEKVIGFAFDGTGFGNDGNIWGGEVLIADYKGFERTAHLDYFPLAGGDASIKRPYRVALSLLRESGIEWDEKLGCVSHCTETEKKIFEGANPKTLEDIRKLAEAEPGVKKVINPLTMHFGPHTILLTVDIEFDEKLSAAEVEETIERLENGVRKKYPDIKHIYIEAGAISTVKRKN
jgi:hydrogenase maturation protein HypF